MTESTSPSLLLRIRSSVDHNAWDEFFEIYAPVVRIYCRQRKIQPADVEDIVQDVMSRVARSIKSFDYDPGKGRFRGWLGTVAANQIKSFLNGKSNENGGMPREAFSSQDVWSDPDSDWVDLFYERVFQVACNRCRAEFVEQTWACFESTWVRNESASDVANSFGIPVHSVYVNKSRVLKRLESEVKLLADDMSCLGDSPKEPYRA